jgi:PD-(D/E)XK nuclease superfamily
MTVAQPLLWYTDRTRSEVGQRHCKMARFLGYHAGAHATGWRRISQSIPLSTGSGVHAGLQLIGEWLQENQRAHNGRPPGIVPDDVIAWAASEAAAGYEQKARSRGFVGIDQQEESAALNDLIAEQRTLIEAQVHLAGLVYLPAVLARYRILGVEVEETLVLACTCGLGIAIVDWRVHQARGCQGIVQQGRADWLLEGWTSENQGQIAYAEFKTKAVANVPWEKAWEHSGQLLVNMEAASRRLGAPVAEAYIVVLFKGYRGRDRNDPPEEPKYQHSPLCYAYYDAGSPGVRPAAWASQYRWTDEYGKGHTLPRTYLKVGIWEEQYPMRTIRSEASRVETWVRSGILPEQYPSLLKVLGPFPRPLARVADALAAIEAEESDWRDLVATLRENGMLGPSGAEELVSRSFSCVHFGGDPCDFYPICIEKRSGWEQPETMGIYEKRRPHHTTELLAYQELGVEFPPDEEELDEIDW